MEGQARCSRRLSTQDASFLYAESRSGPLHIGALGTFDGELEHDRLVLHLEQRLPLLPRYRQRLVFVPFNLAHATLEDDPAFDIRNHVKLHELPKPGGEEQLIGEALRTFERPLDRDRPLWEMHLFTGLEGKRSAVLWNVHHCLVDGVSGMELLTTTLDFRPDAPPPPPPERPWEPASLPTPAEAWVKALFELAQTQLDASRRAVAALWEPSAVARQVGSQVSGMLKFARIFSRPIVSAPWNRGMVTQARTLASLKVSFADVRMIRSAFGGTINDVVLTILSEGAARYLKHHAVEVNAPFRIGCPVNVRHETEVGTLGNRVSMMFPELPAMPMKPVARLSAVIAETGRLKWGGEARRLERLMSGAELISPSLIGAAGSSAAAAIDRATALAPYTRAAPQPVSSPMFGINFIATSVPGPQVPLYLGGHRMLDYIGLLPLSGNLGFGVPIVSYNQKLYFTIMAEPNLMPDPELMKSCVEDAFGELRRSAEMEQHPRRAAAVARAAYEATSIRHKRRRVASGRG